MSSWQQLAEQHRAKQNAAIPREWIIPESKRSQLLGVGGPIEGSLIALEVVRHSGLLSAKELEITENCKALELIHKLSSGGLTSEEVTVAFCKRAAIAQQLVSHERRLQREWRAD